MNDSSQLVVYFSTLIVVEPAMFVNSLDENVTTRLCSPAYLVGSSRAWDSVSPTITSLSNKHNRSGREAMHLISEALVRRRFIHEYRARKKQWSYATAMV